MNKVRRKNIEQLIEQLETVKAGIEEVGDEEQEAFDNLPESLQMGERGEVIQEKADELLGISSELEDLILNLQGVIDE